MKYNHYIENTYLTIVNDPALSLKFKEILSMPHIMDWPSSCPIHNIRHRLNTTGLKKKILLVAGNERLLAGDEWQKVICKVIEYYDEYIYSLSKELYGILFKKDGLVVLPNKVEPVPQPTKEEADMMNITITNPVLINGQDAATMETDALIEKIAKVEHEMEKLSKIKSLPKSSVLQARMAHYESVLAKLVEILDSKYSSSNATLSQDFLSAVSAYRKLPVF